ncbi:hypothetical protein ANO14919_002820 [Xylariales sp. No.14919]|nr:hypothetical protein ANO14919_002820 [Xylariales sp. No.14919]
MCPNRGEAGLSELLGRAEVDVLDEEQGDKYDGNCCQDVNCRYGNQDGLGDDIK